MIINEPIYGKFVVKEPVLLELIKSQPLQRLKKINQHGASQYLFDWKKKTSRFDHSVGVMLLLRKFGASLEEQIAGLLHDISHTAFSHVIDFVYPSDSHDFHEKYVERLILNSKIPEIFKQYHISLKQVLHEENFPLLEKKLPDLCADRIDYFLRHMHDSGEKLDKVKQHVDNLKVHQNEFILKDKKAALAFATDYLCQNKKYWAYPREVTMYKVLAEAIKVSLQKKVINEADLFTTDKKLIEKIRTSKSKKIQKYISLLNPNFKVKIDRKSYHFHLRTKLRYVDPKVLINGKLVRLSKLSFDFKRKLARHNEKMKKGFYVQVLGL